MRHDVLVYVSGPMTAKDGRTIEQNTADGVAVYLEERYSRRRVGAQSVQRSTKGVQMKIIRQGDVLVKRTKKNPSAAAKVVRDQGRTILAYGEVTGHAHEVVATAMPATRIDNVPPQQLFEEPDGTRLLVVRGPVVLRHEEHAPLNIPEGTYEVIRQREYSPEAIRNVAD